VSIAVQWVAAKVLFSHENQALAVDLIADIFDDIGIQGVEVDDPCLEPEEGWGSDAVARPAQPAVTGYFPADERLDDRCRLLEQALSHLSATHPLAYRITYRKIEEQDWAESWKQFFFPEQITPNIVVKPTWRDYTAQPGQQVIEIDPGMAFGTGTHPTTALCVRLLEKYIRPDQSVLDVGTGSGILLIAAAKLGATRLAGVDLDPIAVNVARSNLIQNHIHENTFTLLCGDLIDTVSSTYDVVVANILADVIIDLLDDVTQTMQPGGIFICSGIIQAYCEKVAQKMAGCGFEIKDIIDKGEWVALAGTLK